MKIRIDISDKLLIRARKYAVENGRTLKQVIGQGLRRELQQETHHCSGDRRTVRWATVPGKPAPDLDPADREAVYGWRTTVIAIDAKKLWNIGTHAKTGDRPCHPDEARSFLVNILEDGAGLILYPGTDLFSRLGRWAEELQVQGPRIFDLLIALTARDNGAVEIWTHDASFREIPGLRVVDPL